MNTVDGFPLNNGINFMPEVKPLNPDSPVTKICVLDFYMNPQHVTWRGKTIWVGDYALFVEMIQSWVVGTKFHKPMTKDEALDFAFSV